jgi:hypothetical protein
MERGGRSLTRRMRASARPRLAGLTVVWVLATAHGLSARSSGTLRGSVRDPSGAPVPAATVSIDHAATALRSTVHPDRTGAFLFPSLPIKIVRIGTTARVQMRADVFDLFNHPTFGQPGNVVGSPTFGRITNTRFATGGSESSRQIQLAARVLF